MSVLFISYTGLLEPLGQSQVVPYLEGLAGRGHEMSVLSFERPGASASARAALEERLRNARVGWTPLAYTKRPPVLSTAWDVAVGFRHARRAIRHGVRMIHARAHVPALVAEMTRMATGVPYLFDHRGLMAEEYADAGVWPKGGVLYRLTQRLERRFLGKAARVVVLTEALRGDLGEAAARTSVIPCAVDLGRFRPPSAGDDRPFDLVYAGSWTGLYLRDETLRFFAAMRRRRATARMLLVVPAGSEVGTLPDGVQVQHGEPARMPDLLRQARAGISLRVPGPAQRAASPVKVSEYLACGLAVVSSAGVGDLDALLPERRVGVIANSFDEAALDDAAQRLTALLDVGGDSLWDRCRTVAEERFALESAVDGYDRAYQAVLGDGPSLTHPPTSV